MILYEDTRQKAQKHNNIHDYCQKHNITIIPKYLNVGDYMLPNGTKACDTKASLIETANDLYRDKLAFNKKYKKCLKDGIKLIVLVEEPIKSKADLVKWQNPHGKVSGRMLLDLINRLRLSYGVKFYFCHKKDTGKYLIKLLYEDDNDK